MNAKEIIDEFKKILFSSDVKDEVVESTPEIKDIEVEEEVELAEVPVAKQEDTPMMENPAEKMLEFATKTELAEAVAQFRSMFEQLTDAIKQDTKNDVPKELSAEVVEELSTQEPLSHSPESEVDKSNLLFSQKRGATTLDVVMNKLFKN